MCVLIFDKHPGDIITISDKNNRQVLIQIGAFYLKVIGLIKPTFNRMFKVKVEIPSNKCPREALIKTLNEMVYSREIFEYKIHD